MGRSDLADTKQCDERFPVCANCERARRPCDGPKSRFVRFVKPGAEEHIDYESALLKRPPPTASELLNLEFLERLSKVQAAGYKLQQFGTFFEILPTQIGTNAALDAAIRCLLETHRLALCGVAENSEKDLYHYAEALTLVQQDIDHFCEETPPGTVCAAVILALYEVSRLHIWKSYILKPCRFVSTLHSRELGSNMLVSRPVLFNVR